ncbi:MAG: pacearchaeosortase [Nanoarchaeota archaeon]
MEVSKKINFDKKIIGMIIIFIGLTGILIPGIPGIPLIILGLSILGFDELREKIKDLKIKIEKNNFEKKSSLLIKLYLIPLEWMLLLEKKKIEKKIDEIKEDKINFSKNKIYLILSRYLILLLIVLISPLIIVFILKPLTIKLSVFLLDIFYNISINRNLIIINYKTYISIIDACIAGSAYLLLLILNLTTPMKENIRIKSFIFSWILLFILNILRIIILSILYHEDFRYVNFTHAFFWYGLSTIFVILIWFLTIKIFNIKSIPIYNDFFYLKNISFLKNKIK